MYQSMCPDGCSGDRTESGACGVPGVVYMWCDTGTLHYTTLHHASTPRPIRIALGLILIIILYLVLFDLDLA